MNTRSNKSDAAFVFICQGGNIEINALLLAASLRRHLPAGSELVACVPAAEQNWSQPSEKTLALLSDLNCRIETITNPIDAEYGLANKISCLNVEVNASRRVFLDSDILCMRPLEFSQLPNAEIAAKPADMLTYGKDDDAWHESYRRLGIDLPDIQFTTTVSEEVCPPYFNSGVVMTHREIKIANEWADNVKRISGISSRYFQEQAAFALTVIQLGLNYSLLTEEHNYPANLKPVNAGSEPVLCHYHYPHIIRREPVIQRFVRLLAEDHPVITELMNRQRDWTRVIKPHRRRKGLRYLLPPPKPQPLDRPVSTPELVLTGIPRSGTSYLCRLLDRYRNCVIINEPREAVLGLKDTRIPWALACFFRETRMRILNVDAIKNKLSGGEIQEDTAQQDIRVPYFPNVQSADFILGIKNTQSFLTRINEIREAMPHAKLVACIRDPFDTIASWKSSFAHLKNADVINIPVGNINDPFLSDTERNELISIADTELNAERRARLWSFMASMIQKHQDQLIVVRYEDLVLNPLAAMTEILDGSNSGPLRKPIRPSTIRRKSENLDDDDHEAIRKHCLSQAGELGLVENNY